MKKYVYLAVFTIGILGCSEAQSTVKGEKQKSTVQQSGTVQLVSKSEFQKMLKVKGAQLVDVRTKEEYSSGHMENATNCDYNSSDFRKKMEKLNKNEPVLVYCHAGGRSAKAAQLLKEMGFKKIYDLKGGYSNW